MEFINKTKPEHRELNDNVPKYLVVHTTASPKNTTFEDVYKWHVRERGWEWVGYQWLLYWDGTIVLCRPDETHGAHAKGFNTKSIGIAMCGDGDKHLPSHQQKKALTELLKMKMKEFNIPADNIIPHRVAQELSSGSRKKTCYGTKLKDDWARNLVKEDSVTSNIETCEAELKKKDNLIKVLVRLIKKLLGLST